MNAEQLISLNLQTYQALRKQYGPDDPQVVQIHNNLKDMIVVEIYFMGFLRAILNEDEMSGFILFINDDLDAIIDGFRQSKGIFMPYLKEALENRAMAYLKERIRPISMYRSYLDFYSTPAMAVSEQTPEDVYFYNEGAKELKQRKALMLSALRHMCMTVKGRRKKLFTFFCTLLPFLSRDVIDGFCESINCDRKQTMIIAQKLCKIQEQENENRYSKCYLSRMVDFHWAKILEYEGHAKSALFPQVLKNKADYHRKRLKESLKGFFNAKMNTSYSAVADILNLDTPTVAAYVLYAKQLLEKVANDAEHIESTIRIKRKNEGLTRFEPFVVFKMVRC